ncbi:MAG TPA: crossover junction endodeoxyribonuclease RuvC, partial [Campylobacterales bacterium]|nr:crossover junction endodeoxyribonuclease RuvC [Campylobacterales bacterium]
MKVLGIDPGTQTMGFGIVERVEDTISHIDSGIIKFKNRDLQESIKLIPSLLDEVTREYQIDTISMETLFFAINPKSVIKLAQFRGALLAYFLDRFDRVEEFSPLEIKKSI